jgi:S-adenosylmethionine/arginine decarboxylase-like enzyme
MAAFGYSMHVDLIDCDLHLFADKSKSEYALLDMVSILGMAIQSSPRALGNIHEVNAWVPLIQSGISLCLNLDKGSAFVDAYTCGELNSQLVERYLVNHFHGKLVGSRILERGRQYYDNNILKNYKLCEFDPERQSVSHFGRSFHLDLYGCSQNDCNSIDACSTMLASICDRLNLTKMTIEFNDRIGRQGTHEVGWIFTTAPELNPAMIGLSGYVPLSHSGLSVHTLSLKSFISIDLLADYDVEADRFLEAAMDATGATHYELSGMTRG